MNKRIWENPKKVRDLDQSQTPLWFWNDKLENDELLRQLELKSQVGVTCTIPHARTNMGEGYEGGYLDADWFHKIETVLCYKKEKKEPVWLYDEIDWPAGTCNQSITKDERNREQYLAIEEIFIPAGKVFRAQLAELTGKSIYGIKRGDDVSGYAFNIFAVHANTKERYPITDYFTYLMFGPEFEFSSKDDAIIYIAEVRVQPYEYGGNLQVNYLDDKVTKQFIASTYDQYYEHCGDYFGDTIQCIFNDETRMAHALAWSRDFSKEFQARKGYNLMEKLYELIVPGIEAGRIRCDYFDVLAALFQENYFGEIQKWCKDHKIKLFAHLLGEETMFGHARYSGDYLRQYRNIDIAGADHLGKGIGSLNIKYAACGAHSYGKEMTAVEVFAGCGWDMTFEEYIRMITWLYQQGMQIIINHGFFYSDRGARKDDWPPSQFFQWQGWDRMEQGNAMVRRLHYAMTEGMNESEILIYHPIESFWLHYLPDQHFTHGFFKGAFIEDEEAVNIDRESQLLLNALSGENLDFDLLHKDALDNFRVEEGKIVNCLNGQRFSILLLPMCEVLPIKAAKLAQEFAEAGGSIIALEKLPHMAMDRTQDQALQTIMMELIDRKQLSLMPIGNKTDICTRIREEIALPINITKGCRTTCNLHPAYEAFLIDPYIHTGEELTGIMYSRYIKDGKRNTLFMNYNDVPETIEVEVLCGGEIPEVWNTFTGEITPAKVIEQNPQGFLVELTLPCNYGNILVSSIS